MLSLAKYLQTLVRPRLPDRGRTAPRRSGPDFICIGMQKAGTRWLYQQLRGHPEFWMPPIKELNFFNGNLEKTRKSATYRYQVVEDRQSIVKKSRSAQ